jgi:hypothetical protein
MGKLFSFLDGNKSYLIAILGAVLGILETQGVHIPQPVYVILGSLGIGTLRRAIATKP